MSPTVGGPPCRKVRHHKETHLPHAILNSKGGVSLIDAILTAATAGHNFDQLFSAFDC